MFPGVSYQQQNSYSQFPVTLQLHWGKHFRNQAIFSLYQHQCGRHLWGGGAAMETTQAHSAISPGATSHCLHGNKQFSTVTFQLFWASVISSGSWKQEKLLTPCASCSLQSRCWAMLTTRKDMQTRNFADLEYNWTWKSDASDNTGTRKHWVTCKQMATLTLDPKVVLTAREDSPMSLKSLEKEWVRETRGRSSATTTQVRTQDRLIPRAWKKHRWVQRSVCVDYLCHTAPLHPDLSHHK